MLSEGFAVKPGRWMLMGIVGALAYFAKAYSFPFFLLNTVCCAYFVSKGSKALWLKISGTAIGVMLVCSFPWILALHNKYGIWTTSTAGSLNASWYLVGHQYYNESLGALLPPPYPRSPYYWEDPYLANGPAPHFWDSWYLLGRQVLKVMHNLYKLLASMLQLSVLFPAVTFAAGLLLFSKKIKSVFSKDITIVALSFLLFPLGYLLINFEPRYIWYMLPLGMVMGALILQKYSSDRRVYACCALTFLICPAWGMYNMYDSGKNEYEWAEQLKAQHINGSFTAIVRPGKGLQSAARLAYFSGNSFYFFTGTRITESDLLDEMKRDNIDYFFVYSYLGKNNFIPNWRGENGRKIRGIGIGETNEIQVFKVK
jgi:hypothetical protein